MDSLYAATSESMTCGVRQLPADKQVSARGIEVGHIFYFGTKYSEPMKAVVASLTASECRAHGLLWHRPVRLVAAIIEALHDEAGIIWPEAVAPFKVAILNLKQGAADTDAACEQLYRDLTAEGRRGALPRPRRAAGREICDRRPDRGPVADPGRPERVLRRARSRSRNAPMAAANMLPGQRSMFRRMPLRRDDARPALLCIEPAGPSNNLCVPGFCALAGIRRIV